MSTPSQFSLRSIGNFVGLRLKELADLMGQKASRTEVEALRRWSIADGEPAMLGLADARVGDLCIRSDNGSALVLEALPPTIPGHWRPVLRGGVGGAGGSMTVSLTFPLVGEVTPVLTHSMGKLPISVMVLGADGRPHYVDYLSLDADRLQLNFTEAVEGTCSLVFVS